MTHCKSISYGKNGQNYAKQSPLEYSNTRGFWGSIYLQLCTQIYSHCTVYIFCILLRVLHVVLHTSCLYHYSAHATSTHSCWPDLLRVCIICISFLLLSHFPPPRAVRHFPPRVDDARSYRALDGGRRLDCDEETKPRIARRPSGAHLHRGGQHHRRSCGRVLCLTRARHRGDSQKVLQLQRDLRLPDGGVHGPLPHPAVVHFARF